MLRKVLRFSLPGFDRQLSETTAQGIVSYTYDNASRRATLQAPGQAQVVYAYDNANRLTGITQGTQSVAIGYDNANRRTSLTLPNGINLTYGYDNANQLTGITYKKGAATLGDLTYGYDLAGRRTNQAGSFARTGLPLAQTANTHDSNNRLTLQDATALSYDDNGNLLGDGVNSYTWNSRDQLTAVAGPVAASFQYDAIGRRKQKTIAGTTSNYLYDGLNIVQEQGSGGSVIADHLTSLGIDEVFTRTEGGTTKTLLRDALGSTIAMADGTGIQTSWTYDPYGKATYTGVAQSNPFLYTGRELDGTGLYYYRARYYHPTLNRFIAEDPIGLAGGANIYAYVGGNPISNFDPLGLWTGQIGISVTFQFGPVTYSFNGGVAFDGYGNIAGYTEHGPGGGFGADLSGGISVKGSNGETIGDLAGTFGNISDGGGWGPHATGDGFWGTGQTGQPVFGGGVTVGLGAGGGANTTMTNTTLGNPIFGPMRKPPCP